MALHRPLAPAERRPGEQRQAEVDDGRIQGIDRLREFDAEVLGRVQGAGGGDQPLGEVGSDPPVAQLVGMSQGVAGDRAPEPHVVELGLGHAEAGLDVPQTLPVSELGEGQAEELVPAREALDLVLPLVVLPLLAVHAAADLVRGHEVHQLAEDRPTSVHESSPRAKMRAYGPRRLAGSNR